MSVKSTLVGTLHDASVTVGQGMPLVPDPSPSSEVMKVQGLPDALGEPLWGPLTAHDGGVGVDPDPPGRSRSS